MAIQIVQTSYEVIPTGKYAAKVAAIEAADGQFGPQLKFRFELAPDATGKTRNLTGFTSARFNPKTKLYKWTAAALRKEIARDYTFNSDDLLGRYVFLTVLEKSGDKGMYSSIEDVLPYVKPQPVITPPLDDPDF